jgi:hypothetical protein
MQLDLKMTDIRHFHINFEYPTHAKNNIILSSSLTRKLNIFQFS